MIPAPNLFLTVFKIAGFTEEASRIKWVEMWRDIWKEFFIWLIDQSSLNGSESSDLNDGFDLILKGEVRQGLMKIFAGDMNITKEKEVWEKLAELFLRHLEKTYDEVGAQMNSDQMQVYKSYLKVNNV